MRFDGKKHATFALVALLGLTLALPASADRGWGGGWGRGEGWGWGGFGVGLLGGAMIGSALARPYYYPAYVYAGYPAYPAYPAYPTTVVVQQQAPAMPAYVQAPQAYAPAQQAPMWYYCDAAGGYYPYVQSCPQPWRPVPAR
ncbi:MAG: hypothetical protein KGL63_14705 [Betaproteobacteria bacterium]|nr:hypothetical protein [Betaproteobacteria bacterium]